MHFMRIDDDKIRIKWNYSTKDILWDQIEKIKLNRFGLMTINYRFGSIKRYIVKNNYKKNMCIYKVNSRIRVEMT